MNDAAFSSGALGKGIAIMPEEGILYAPADGAVTAIFPTGHAIGMVTEDGAEILIHVAMDTVKLEGRGFTPLTSVGSRVSKGQKKTGSLDVNGCLHKKSLIDIKTRLGMGYYNPTKTCFFVPRFPVRRFCDTFRNIRCHFIVQ